MQQPSPQPGDFGLTQIGGDVGKGIGFAQFLAQVNWKPWQWRAIWRRSRREHAFIFTGYGDAGDGIVEAEPGGARRGSTTEYSTISWSSGIIQLTEAQRQLIVNAATGYANRKVPYSFLDYLAYAAHRFHLPIPFLRRYIASSGHMICSQLVDLCYEQAGVRLFKDGRWAGYVDPDDLDGVLGV